MSLQFLYFIKNICPVRALFVDMYSTSMSIIRRKSLVFQIEATVKHDVSNYGNELQFFMPNLFN